MKGHVILKYDMMVLQLQTMVILMVMSVSGMKMDVKSLIETPKLYLLADQTMSS